MPAILRVAGRDLSAFLRLAHEEGLEPHDIDSSEPQFSGSLAYAEGQSYAGDAVDNQERAFPLILAGQTPADVEQLKRDIRADLARGAQIEFRVDDQAGESTFWTLETGRLEIAFEYWISRASRQRCTLRLWTKPYGTAATQRVAAAISPGAGAPLATQSIVHFPVTGVLGDVNALANLEVRVGSKVASSGRVIGFGVHRSASYAPLFTPGDGRSEAQASSVIQGASGAVASRVHFIPVSPTGASGVAYRAFLTPPEAHVGRHRIFGLAQSGLDQPITMWARDRFGAPLGPTTAASQTNPAKIGLVDLGEIYVPARASGMEPTPTQVIELIAGGASGAAIVGSPALKLNGLCLLPLDLSPGIMRTRGADGQQIAGDTFARLGNTNLSNSPDADEGGVWKQLLGRFGGFKRGLTSVYPTGPAPDAGATPAVANLGPAANLTDLQIRAEFRLMSSAAAGPSSRLDIRKVVGTGFFFEDGVMARFIPGPSQTLQIIRTDQAVPSVIASAGIATARASGVYQGQPHQLVMEIFGPTVSVYLGTNPAVPALVAGVDLAQLEGRVDLGLRNASAGESRAIQVRSLRAYTLGASAVDAAPREVFRFESDPEPRAIQGNASVYVADRTAEFRGDFPRVPAVGSPGASGPARMVVLAGDVDDFLGNDVLDVSVKVVERFEWLR